MLCRLHGHTLRAVLFNPQLPDAGPGGLSMLSSEPHPLFSPVSRPAIYSKAGLFGVLPCASHAAYCGALGSDTNGPHGYLTICQCRLPHISPTDFGDNVCRNGTARVSSSSYLASRARNKAPRRSAAPDTSTDTSEMTHTSQDDTDHGTDDGDDGSDTADDGVEEDVEDEEAGEMEDEEEEGETESSVD